MINRAKEREKKQIKTSLAGGCKNFSRYNVTGDGKGTE